MSFLGDLIGSIGGERPPTLPTQPIQPSIRTATTNPQQSTASKSAPNTPSTARPVYKGTLGLGAPQQAASLKRKAEEISSERPVKLPKSSLQNSSDREAQKPSRADSQPNLTKSSAEPSSQNAANAPKFPAKPPTKGSYAALMARAKDAQTTKTPSAIGVIKHQATEKEKVKTSKLAERKRLDQEKDKGRISNTGQSSKMPANAKLDPRRRSASPVKKGTAPKVAQAPKPPLHGPRKEVAPSYRGTLGQAPKRSKEEIRAKAKGRRDEYLGTDESEGDDGYGYDDDEADDYSDDSADMEGRLSDIEMEEERAMQAAKDDDARELALEMKLKREKEERKRKLAAMAKKHSR